MSKRIFKPVNSQSILKNVAVDIDLSTLGKTSLKSKSTTKLSLCSIHDSNII